MAINRWIGRAPAVSKISTLTVGSAVAAQTFIVTSNSKPITYTAGAGETTATIAAALAALLAASTEPEFREAQWSYPGTGAVITGTATTAGVPFAVTVSGTGTLTLATPTVSSGPNHIDLAANWSLGVLPGTDDVLIDGGPALLWGFENVVLAAHTSFRVKGSFTNGGPGGCTGLLGLDYWNPNGYVEYRGRGWPMASGVPVTIGEGDGSGPSRCNITSGLVLNAIVVETGQRVIPSVPVVNISGCTSGVLTVAAGDVALAADDDALAAVVTTTTIGAGANLVVGRGATATTLLQDGGTVLNLGAVGAVVGISGTFSHFGTIATSVTGKPGPWEFDWRCGGTIPSMVFKGQGPGQDAPVLECVNDPRAKTITNGTFTGGAVLHDTFGLVAMSNPLNFDRASVAASDLGAQFTLTRTIT